MEEIWKQIKGFKNKYLVSNYGSVKSIDYNKTGKEQILKQFENSGGYLQVFLGKGNEPLVAKLVYEAFIGIIPNGMQVNHIDENKANNAVWNLNLMTPKENANWGTRNERMIETRNKKGLMFAETPILQFTKENVFVCEYKSQAEASRQTGIPQGNINKCLKHKLKTAGDFIWKYKRDTE